MNAKSLIVPMCAAVALAVALLAPPPTSGQAGAAEDPALAALVTEVSAQQAVILENQDKIDAKLATVAENVRLARIFASRGK